MFLQGGAIGENGIVPLNLASRINAAKPKTDFVVTGTWSVKTEQEARRYSDLNGTIGGGMQLKAVVC